MAHSLQQVFEQNAHRRWFFLAPGGNWGDDLIYRGAEALARRAGVTWTDVSRGELPRLGLAPEDALYLHGSGGFNTWCSGRPFGDLEAAMAREVALVVQGPSTAEDDDGLLRERIAPALRSSAAAELLFFAREETTRRNLERALGPEPLASILLDHDTALNLTAQDLMDLADRSGERVPAGRYLLDVRREDPESAGLGPAPLSRVVLDPAYFARSFEHWLALHIEARSVTSDRLHSAIVSTLLGKDVTLFPGSYHKNRSVFEHSLRDRGVRWQEADPAPTEPALLRRVRNSYKFRRLKCFLAGVPTE
jgi:hypothetical protein